MAGICSKRSRNGHGEFRIECEKRKREAINQAGKLNWLFS